MKARHGLRVFLIAISCGLPLALLGQSQAMAQAQSSLVGSWLLTVVGEMETRTLVVTEEAPTGDGALLEAKYGITNRGLAPINAKMLRVGDKRQLNLAVPQTGTQITATEQGDGTFSGTFTPKTGSAKAVFMVGIDDAMRQRLAQGGPSAALARPGPDVPASCAGFFGGWAGGWAVGNLGPQRLWVVAIKPDCTARVSYRVSDSNDLPKSLSDATIDKGALAIPCGEGGTCVFELHGDEVWASYSNTGGGRNNGVFRKVP